MRSRLCLISSLFACAAAVAPGAPAMDEGGGLQSSGALARDTGRPRLDLWYVDFTGQTAEAIERLRAETAALVSRLGVEAAVGLTTPAATLDARALTLILMDGPPPAQLSPGVMGVVQRQGSARVLWIYAASVAAGARLPWPERDRWSPRQRAEFTTALARVSVHEIVHLVCPWRDHDADGLMAQTLSAAHLTGARLPLSVELRRDFLAGVDALAGLAWNVARDGLADRP